MFRRPDKINDTLYLITAVFNPKRYRSRWKILNQTQKHFLAGGCHLITIEAVFGERDKVFTERLSDKHTIIHVNAKHEVWLKENLYNIAVNHMTILFPNWKYVAMVDGDLEFGRPDWVGETLQLLQHYPIIQMFSQVSNLSPDKEILSTSLSFMEGWRQGIPFKNQHGSAQHHSHYGDHQNVKIGWAGAPGGAWAYTRDALDALGGLIDYAILGCYDEETMVYTKRGFIQFKDLTMDDIVLSRSSKGDIEWGPVTKIFKYEYEGDMYRIKSQSMDLLITPNHKMVYKNRYTREEYFEKIEDFKGGKIIPKCGSWAIDTPKDFELFGASSIENFVAFMGIWLSEGWVYLATDNDKYNSKHYRIGIAQRKPESLDKIRVLLQETFPDMKWNELTNNGQLCGFMGNNKNLFNYLKKIGKCIDKYIPTEIKELPAKYLETFLEWFILGDGNVENKKEDHHQDTLRCFTSSEKLRDDLIEVIIKTGKWAGYSTRNGDISYYEREDRYITTKHPHYRIHIHRSKDFFLKESAISVVPYKGMVYCCETPHHTLLVKRGTKMVWCGNSADYHMAVALMGFLHISMGSGGTSNSKDYHPDYIKMMMDWQDNAIKKIKRNVGVMKGVIFHSWHGKMKDRGYDTRWKILIKHQYNPRLDIVRNSAGVIHLNEEKWQLRDDAREYFNSRNEDSIDL